MRCAYTHLYTASHTLHGSVTGKTTFFVANQANLEDMPAQKLAELETQYKKADEENKSLAGDVKSLGAGAYSSLRRAAPPYDG